MAFPKSAALYEEAKEVLVGGVNSPVRAFKSVGGNPLFMSRGEGPYIYDADGNKYIDYVGSYGPLILGHGHPKVKEAIKNAVDSGTCFGASSEGEITLAKLVIEAFPSIEMVRFVNSGTEAVMSALRLARGFTKRNLIVKFSGCYHGHSDFLLAQAGSGLMTYGLPGSAGVPEATAHDTLIAPYNDIVFLRELFAKFPEQIAAVIIEPVVGNMGVVLPENDFLLDLRTLSDENGSLLIFDEVMTGFRECFGGVQTTYKIQPDITCLGKVIGGGMPVGAYGARKEIMEMVSPLGPVYQAGTLSGNPVAMAAGIATLTELKAPGFYNSLLDNTALLANSIFELAEDNDVPLQVASYGSMLTPFFTSAHIRDYTSAMTADTGLFTKVFWALIKKGVYAPPSQFEAWFVSAAHSTKDIDQTLTAFEKAFRSL